MAKKNDTLLILAGLALVYAMSRPQAAAATTTTADHTGGGSFGPDGFSITLPGAWFSGMEGVRTDRYTGRHTRYPARSNGAGAGVG